jgi:hypothetical protein
MQQPQIQSNMSFNMNFKSKQMMFQQPLPKFTNLNTATNSKFESFFTTKPVC